MKVLCKILMNLKQKNGSLEIPIFEVFSKEEFKGLSNKFKRLRLLTDGEICFCWDAQEFDHFTVLNHLKSFGKNVSNFKRFIFENGKIEKSIPEGGEDLVMKKFERKLLNQNSANGSLC